MRVLKIIGMFNQKGFIVAPILVWAVIGLLALGIIISRISNKDKELSKVQNSQVVDQQPAIKPSPSTDPANLIDTVRQFYSNISSRQFNQAWILLSKNFQSNAKNYDNFVKGYDTTRSVLVQEIHVQDLSNDIIFIKLQSTDTNYDQIQTKDYSGTWKLIKEDGFWKLDSADIALLNVSPSSKALNVAAFVYAYSDPIGIEEWRNKHGIKKSSPDQEIHDQALWLDQHPDVLILSETSIQQYKNQLSQQQAIYQAPPPSSIGNGSMNEAQTKSKEFGRAAMYNQVGNTFFGTDGTSYSQIGNTTMGSNGTSYNSVGNNFTFGSDGTNYIHSGNTTFGSNGTTCFTYGTMTQCMGGY